MPSVTLDPRVNVATEPLIDALVTVGTPDALGQAVGAAAGVAPGAVVATGQIVKLEPDVPEAGARFSVTLICLKSSTLAA